MAEATVTMPALQTLLRAPFGPVGVTLRKRAANLAVAAKGLAPYNAARRGGAIHLRDGIEADNRTFDTGSGIGIYVRSKAPHSQIVHEGSAAHPISARNSSNVLHFLSRGERSMPAGEWFINTSRKPVQHPGTRPNPFLRNAGPAALHP